MHAHLDHDNCMEVTILRGKAHKVQHFAEHVIAERGVRHGRMVLVPTEMLVEPHSRHGPTPTIRIRHRREAPSAGAAGKVSRLKPVLRRAEDRLRPVGVFELNIIPGMMFLEGHHTGQRVPEVSSTEVGLWRKGSSGCSTTVLSQAESGS